jgi:hypothetical protein
MLFLRETSTTSEVVKIVNEATTYLARKRVRAGTTSGQASRACQVRQMASRSSAVKACKPNSVSTASSIARCTSSLVHVGCSAASIACKERRRYSFVMVGQSACRPRRAPAVAKARLMPWCQSRMVPPVSKVSALMFAIMHNSPQGAHTRSMLFSKAILPSLIPTRTPKYYLEFCCEGSVPITRSRPS